jgi:hypothetical protein
VLDEKMSEGCGCLMLWPSFNTAGNGDGKKKKQPWGKPAQWSVVSETILHIVRGNRGKHGHQDEAPHPNGVFKTEFLQMRSRQPRMKGADVGQNKWATLAWSGIVELGDRADFHSRRRPKDEEVQRPKTMESLRISPNIRSMIDFLMKEWLQRSL